MPRMKAHGPKLYKNLKNSGVIAKADFKFVPKDPEPGFDPAHNMRVIEETIKKTKEREKQLKKAYMEKVEERVDAGIYLLKKMANAKFNPNTDNSTAFAMKYYGKKELARLRGEEIKHELFAKLKMAQELVN